jgi:transcriptional antiterminator NusG
MEQEPFEERPDATADAADAPPDEAPDDGANEPTTDPATDALAEAPEPSPSDLAADALIMDETAGELADEALAAEVQAAELAVEAVREESVAEELAEEAREVAAAGDDEGAEDLAAQAASTADSADELGVEAVETEAAAEDLAVEAMVAEAAADELADQALEMAAGAEEAESEAGVAEVDAVAVIQPADLSVATLGDANGDAGARAPTETVDLAAAEAEVAEAEAAEAEAAEAEAAEAEAVVPEPEAEVEEAGDTSRTRGPGDWYVVHTYSGYENKVKANLGQRIASMQMEDKIFEVVIPMEDVMEIKGGKKQVVQRKVFPGYLLVRMIYDNDSWYVVRNTPGVTGFVSSGTGTKPTPLSVREVQKILAVKEDTQKKPEYRLEWEEGDVVRIVSGPFADFTGTISEINVEQSKLRVMVNIFDRETPVELAFDQVAKA